MRAITGALLLAGLILVPAAGAFAAPDEEIDAMEQEIAELKAIVETLTARLDALLDRVRSLREDEVPVPEPFPAGIEGTYRLDPESMIDNFLARRLEEEAEELEKLGEEERALRVAEIRKSVEEDMGAFDLTVTLLPEGRFEASAEFMGEAQKASGTWTLDGENILLVTTHENGEEQEHPEEISGTLKDGVMHLTDDEMSFILKK